MALSRGEKIAAYNRRGGRFTAATISPQKTCLKTSRRHVVSQAVFSPRNIGRGVYLLSAWGGEPGVGFQPSAS